jgi:hypothetical protein
MIKQIKKLKTEAIIFEITLILRLGKLNKNNIGMSIERQNIIAFASFA